MKSKRIFGAMVLFLLTVIALCGAVNAVPVSIEEVQIDGTEVYQYSTNKLSLERDAEFEVRVEFTALADSADVEVEAFISGYEYNDFERISDTTHVFDVEEGVKYVKKLTLNLPDKVEEDSYKLRILVTDRNSEPLIQEYSLKIDVARHGMEIADVVFNPGREVMAGRALLTSVRVENQGQNDEDDVRVEVRMPELGISAVDYIDTIEAEEEEETEEIYLRLPDNVKTGIYTLDIIVSYDEGYESVRDSTTINVVGNAAAEDDETEGTAPAAKAKTQIVVGSQMERVVPGEAGAIYPITIKNNGKASRAYTLVVEGTNDWADVKITPTSTLVIGAGEEKSLYIFVSAKDDAAVGPQVFTATVSSGADTLEQVTLTANVAEGKGRATGALVSVLKIVLLALVVLLVIIGLIVGFSKLKSKEENDFNEETQTYY